MIALRKDVAIVFQQYNLFPHKTALENIMMAPRQRAAASRAPRSRSARTRSGEGRAGRQGVDAIRASSPAASSSASPSRARSPCGREVMLFDEVTAALDPETVKEVLLTIGSSPRTA